MDNAAALNEGSPATWPNGTEASMSAVGSPLAELAVVVPPCECLHPPSSSKSAAIPIANVIDRALIVSLSADYCYRFLAALLTPSFSVNWPGPLLIELPSIENTYSVLPPAGKSRGLNAMTSARTVAAPPMPAEMAMYWRWSGPVYVMG